ncbi:MAG TPA: hypothetical protein VD828_00635, partial [Candidatus Nitrosotenuis sp.]|nr:hypothetical protein [Candidatus Nitrosotenuis sp.]
FFLFAVTISLAAPLEFVLAQEMSEDEMMDEEAMDEQIMEDTMMEDEQVMEEVMDDTVMEDTMMEEPVASPLKQMAMGVDPHEIQCDSGQKLVFKSSNWRPACVNESSFDILLERGWVSSHDPSHEDLTKMIDDYLATQPEVIEEPENDGEIQIEEDVTMEGETDTDGGNQTEPQSHTIELREDMEMGAQ